MQELAILAAEDGASNEVVNNLERAEVIPFFGNKQYWEIPAAKWGEFLYPAYTLSDDPDWIWTIISAYSLCTEN